METVAHEIGHVAQYHALGLMFVGRWLGEGAGDASSYVIPQGSSLDLDPISQINVVDSHYNLEAIANRIGREAVLNMVP